MRCLQSRLCAPCHGSTHYHVQGIFPGYGRKKTLVCTTTDRWCCFVFFIRCILIFCVCNQYPVKFDGQSTPPFTQILSIYAPATTLTLAGIIFQKINLRNKNTSTSDHGQLNFLLTGAEIPPTSKTH